MWLQLTWYGMCIPDEQGGGHGRVFVELNDGKYQTYCDKETYLRLKHLDETGINLPRWAYDFLDENKSKFEG